MPATLPTHPLAVLPLKLWRPRRFDGVALAVGAAAPDVAYAFDGLGLTIHSHGWPALFWWGLPVTLALTWLLRRAAPTVAAHLPAGGPFALRDYGVLGRVHHPWRVTCWSALIGTASHLAWDAVTHPEGIRAVFGPGWTGPVGVPGWYPIVLASDVAGVLAALLLARHLGRHRLLRAWHGDPCAAPVAPAPFWAAVTVVAVPLLATLPVLPGEWYYHVVGVRIICVLALALLAGAAAARVVTRRRPAVRAG